MRRILRDIYRGIKRNPVLVIAAVALVVMYVTGSGPQDVESFLTNAEAIILMVAAFAQRYFVTPLSDPRDADGNPLFH